VSDVVTYDPVVVDEASSLESATARMREHGVRRLPIVDHDGAVVGIVTADDVAVLLGRELAELTSAIDENADASESR
jgi:predicted transcriptional regulator